MFCVRINKQHKPIFGTVYMTNVAFLYAAEIRNSVAKALILDDFKIRIVIYILTVSCKRSLRCPIFG